MIPMISVPQAHLMHHVCLRMMLHCDNCVLHPPFSFSGLFLKLTYTSFNAAMSLASLNDDSWLVALAILGKHQPLSSVQTSGPAFPQHHPHPAWTHWPNRFRKHTWVKCLVLLRKWFKSSPSPPSAPSTFEHDFVSLKSCSSSLTFWN